MNRSFNVAVLTVTMIIMISAVCYAAPAPHGFTCDICHGKIPVTTIGTILPRTSTMCIGCHTTGAQATRMPLNSGDMSNYFGTVTGQPAKGSRSSHTWDARASFQTYSVPNVREAQTINLNYGFNEVVLSKTVTCIRCHDSKGYGGTKYTGSTNTIPDVDKPFLRMTNVNDAMCLDCHNPRNTPTQASGSHPVNYRAYSTVYKLNTTAYRRNPLSANPNNPTAQLANYFANGKIVCSTCHATHYADSNSATLDNRSTANGFAQDDPAKGLKGQLQDSKGQLVRTDPIGATANAINVCSSCHKETKNQNHNGRGQNVQCDHCHGAHVDFTGDKSAPNLYLVRRDFSNMSTSKVKLGSNVKVIYNSATSLRFARADNKGICQVCHAPTHSISTDAHKDNCLECHNHANGFSAVNCTSCHGQPPMTSLVGGPNGKSSQDYAVDESLTPHATHADSAYYNYACKNCHYAGTRVDSHNTATKTFASVFVDTAGSVGDQVGLTKNIPSDYNSSAKTCANVYCHSNGNPRGGSIQWKDASTPSWENGKNAILGKSFECNSCHDSGGFAAYSGAALNTNAHYTHTKTNSIKCYVCHAATVNAGMLIIDRSMHANGSKNVSFVNRPDNYVSIFTATWNEGAGTCANSCHTNGAGGAASRTPLWTEAAINKGAAYCGSCHLAVANTSLHPVHFTGTTGPKLGTNPDCASCHVYSAGATTHANGVVDLKAGNSCAPCHPSAAPVWATNAKVTCESCHSGAVASYVVTQSGSYTASLKGANGHSQYSSATLKHIKCTTCHDASVDHIGAGPAQKRLLVTGNALCTTCHVAGKEIPEARIDMLSHGAAASKPPVANAFANYTTTNDGRANECAGCHDTHGTTNLSAIRTQINGHPIVYTDRSTGFFVSSPTNGIYNGLCQVCHTKTKYFRNNVDPTASLSHTLGDTNCMHCHYHKSTPTQTVMFAFQGAGGGCGGCHGYPPASSVAGLKTIGNYSSAKLQSYSGGGGAHTVSGHLPRTIRQAEKWNNCTNCHYGNNDKHNQGGTPITFEKRSYVNVIVDPKFKFRNDTSITYNAGATSCSNVSCHFKPSPKWTNGQ